MSNAVAVHDANNLTNVFCLCDDGQVYYRTQFTGKMEFGKWLAISSKLPFEEGFNNFLIKLQIKETKSMVGS